MENTKNDDDDDDVHEKILAAESSTEIKFILQFEDILPFGSTKGRGIKILPPKQLLQRLPILLAQVQAENTSENLLNKIRQFFNQLY